MQIERKDIAYNNIEEPKIAYHTFLLSNLKPYSTRLLSSFLKVILVNYFSKMGDKTCDIKSFDLK